MPFLSTQPSSSGTAASGKETFASKSSEIVTDPKTVLSQSSSGHSAYPSIHSKAVTWMKSPLTTSSSGSSFSLERENSRIRMDQGINMDRKSTDLRINHPDLTNSVSPFAPVPASTPLPVLASLPVPATLPVPALLPAYAHCSVPTPSPVTELSNVHALMLEHEDLQVSSTSCSVSAALSLLPAPLPVTAPVAVSAPLPVSSHNDTTFQNGLNISGQRTGCISVCKDVAVYLDVVPTQVKSLKYSYL